MPQIKKLPLFAHRTPVELDTILQSVEEVTLKHRGVLYKVGDFARSFAVVVQGAFKLVRSTPDGHDIIVFFATPGDIIGGLLMSTVGSSYPVTVVAMGPAVVLKFSRESFQKNWALDRAMQQQMGGMLFNRMSLMHDHKALAKAPLTQKIACQLVSLIERYSGQNETILPIPLTRQEIADSVGASVESVIRVMSDWSRAGIIETSEQLIHILKMEHVLEIIKGTDGA